LSDDRFGVITPEMPGRAASVSLVVVAILMVAGCNRPTWSTPEGAYASFARAVKKGEYKLAWGALSETSRTMLEERSKELAAASGGALEDDPQALFFGSVEQPPAARKIEVERQEGIVAMLAVTPEEGPAKKLRMLKEAGGWKLDVSDALKD
jgi:hypothetical protein